MAVFRQDPLCNRLELFIRPSADQFLGEIDMHFLRRTFGTGSETAQTSLMASTNPTPAVAEKAFLVGDPIAIDECHGFFSGSVRNRETQPSQEACPAHARLRVLFWKLRPRFTERGLIVRARRRLSPPIAPFLHRLFGIALARVLVACRTSSRLNRIVLAI